MRSLILILLIAAFVICYKPKPTESKAQKEKRFSFVFMTDIHVIPELNEANMQIEEISIEKINP